MTVFEKIDLSDIGCKFPKVGNSDGGYVYVMETDSGCKIGSTRNPAKRMRQLELMFTGYGRTQVRRCAISGVCKYYRWNENILHSIFGEYRVDGTELFETNFDYILNNIPDGFETYNKKELTDLEKDYDIQTINNPRNCDFIWVMFKNVEPCFKEISNPNLMRMFYVATFMKNGNVIFDKTRVNSLLKLSRRASLDFWKETANGNIFSTDNKIVYANSNYFKRGFLDKRKINNNNIGFIRVYNTFTRTLYNSYTPRQHKVLSYVFRVIPYVNRRHNILCWNPEEYDCGKITPITLIEFCNMVGYAESNDSRLIAELRGLTVNGKRIISYASDKRFGGTWVIKINPELYYGGPYDNIRDSMVREFRIASTPNDVA